jgi:Tfp pilus assembly protein PilX
MEPMKILQKSKDRPMEHNSLLKNEDGSIIVIVLVVLMLVTMMGISSTTTSTIELQIAANDKRYKENFYNAEGATMEALQTMDAVDSEALKLNNAPSTLAWLMPGTVDLTDGTAVAANTAVSAAGDGSRYYAINRGFTTGTSLGMTGTSQLYTFEVHGFIDKGAGGFSHIEVGYKRRF